MRLSAFASIGLALSVLLGACNSDNSDKTSAAAAISPASVRTGTFNTSEMTQLRQAGRWYVDQAGRVMILRGMNMMNKLPPYLSSALGFDQDDAAFLASQGYNYVRLGVNYGRIEPKPGVFDDSYIDAIKKEVEVLSAQGIYVQLSSDNNCFGSKFGGQGMPDWMGIDDGLPSVGASQGFPTCYFVFNDLGMNRAWDHFWANDPAPDGKGLQDHYAEGWARLARALRGNPFVLGYDHLNEPWAGSDAITCASPTGCPVFETGRLTEYTKKITAVLKQAHPEAIMFGEPQLLFDFGAKSWLRPFGQGNLGFSFHSYCIPELLGSAYGLDNSYEQCSISDELAMTNALTSGQETQSAPIMSEFGATDVLPTLTRMANIADKYMMSWAHWTYFGKDPCCERPQEGIIKDISRPPTPDNIKKEKVDVLVRPFPRLISGTPQSFAYEPNSKVFSMTYRPAGVDSGVVFPAGSITEIFVPERHYAKGYKVDVKGATVVSEPDARVLKLALNGGATEVTVKVTAR